MKEAGKKSKDSICKITALSSGHSLKKVLLNIISCISTKRNYLSK